MYIYASIIGVCVGMLSGLLGIGGAIVMIPALVYFLGFSQHTAQGTALAAMVPPIGLLAAYVYYKNGFVNIPVALLVSAGFIIGAFAGAKLSIHVDDNILKKIFGLILFITSIKIFFGK